MNEVFGTDNAVRALYLVSGAVDVAVETGDHELLDAVIAQWDHAIAARTYLTSGQAIGSLRAPWFNVSCCPTNIARTLASLAGYVATSGDRGVQLHQLTACDIRTVLPDGRTVALRADTDYPRTGTVTVRVEESTGGPWSITLRVPAWARARPSPGTAGPSPWPRGS